MLAPNKRTTQTYKFVPASSLKPEGWRDETLQQSTLQLIPGTWLWYMYQVFIPYRTRYHFPRRGRNGAMPRLVGTGNIQRHYCLAALLLLCCCTTLLFYNTLRRHAERAPYNLAPLCSARAHASWRCTTAAVGLAPPRTNEPGLERRMQDLIYDTSTPCVRQCKAAPRHVYD